MNIDHSNLVKYFYKDSVNFSNLNEIGVTRFGQIKYELKGFVPLEVLYSPESKKVSVKANFPYFWQGHNLSVSTTTIRQASEYVSDIIGTDLNQFHVDNFEFGSSFETQLSPSNLIAGHNGLKGYVRQLYNRGQGESLLYSGLEYKSPTNNLKIYDAGFRLKKNTSLATRQNLVQELYYSPQKNYTKVELSIKKPIAFFKINSLTFKSLQNLDFLAICKRELISVYSNINKGGYVKQPESKKDLTTSKILLLYFMSRNQNLVTENTVKDIQAFLKAYEGNQLNKHDIKHRIRQLKRTVESIQVSEQSPFDLKETLQNIPITY